MRDVARFFKALADEARVEMLWLLFNHRELCVCDLMAALEITQSKASRHLDALRHAGLVTGRRDGLWMYYAIRDSEDELAASQLEALRSSLARRPEASVLLRKLHDWLKAKNRGAACTDGAACSANRKRGGRTAPVRRAGGIR